MTIKSDKQTAIGAQRTTSALPTKQIIVTQFTQAQETADNFRKALAQEQSRIDKEISAMTHELEQTDYSAMNESAFVLQLKRLLTERRKVKEELAEVQSIVDKARTFTESLEGGIRL